MIDFSVTEFESAIFRARPFAALHRQDGRKSTDLQKTVLQFHMYIIYLLITKSAMKEEIVYNHNFVIIRCNNIRYFIGIKQYYVI